MAKKKPGTKPMYDQSASRVLQVRVTPQQLNRIQDQATKVNAETVSDYVRKLLIPDEKEKYDNDND